MRQGSGQDFLAGAVIFTETTAPAPNATVLRPAEPLRATSSSHSIREVSELVYVVTTMMEPALRILSRDPVQRRAKRLGQDLTGAGSGGAQAGPELTEGQFNGGKIRRVGW